MLSLVLFLVSANEPALRFVKPQGDVFAGKTEIEVSTDIDIEELVGLEVFVNDVSIYYGHEAPFVTSVNLSDFDEGPVVIKAVLYQFSGPDEETVLEGRNVSSFYAENVRLVHVPVLVEGQRELVSKLALRDFQLLENGKPQKLTRAFTDQAPLFVVLVVDLSGSMKSKLPMLKRGMYSFFDMLTEHDSVQIMGFNERVFQVIDFEKDHDILKRRALRLEAQGDTNLYGALWSGIRASANVNGRRAVMIFTDGHQEMQNSGDLLNKSLEDCIQLAQEEGIPVYTMGVGAHIAPDVLTKIAKETGGESFILKNRSTINKAFETLGRRLGFQFLLGYYTESPQDGWHAVSVVCPDLPELVLHYPSRLYFR